MQAQKKYTKLDKINIILECIDYGVNVTLEKYNVIKSTYYFWKKKYSIDVEAKLQWRNTFGNTSSDDTKKEYNLDHYIYEVEKSIRNLKIYLNK